MDEEDQVQVVKYRITPGKYSRITSIDFSGWGIMTGGCFRGSLFDRLWLYPPFQYFPPPNLVGPGIDPDLYSIDIDPPIAKLDFVGQRRYVKRVAGTADDFLFIGGIMSSGID